MNFNELTLSCNKISDNIEKVMIGKKKVVNYILTALLAGGHVLLEDVPGTGKTVLAKALAKSIHADFNRIQFTPDLLPSDITGLNFYNSKENCFTFRQGPVFTNILLADEINRATPRTQSSLLECMEEKQITIDGETRKLNKPFIVIATQNPIETAGTYPLPEAQLDRFIMKIDAGFPTHDEEIEILNRFIKQSPLDTLSCVCEKEELIGMQEIIKDVFVHPIIMDYMVNIIVATRSHKSISIGVSPRGSLAFLRTCQAYAAIKGRTFVTPEDVKELANPVLSHRMILRGQYNNSSNTNELLSEILSTITVPTEDFSKVNSSL